MGFLCTECFGDSPEIAQPLLGVALALHEGEYLLVGGDGHTADILFSFPTKPTVDPDYEQRMPDGASPPEKQIVKFWENDVRAVLNEFVMGPEDGKAVMDAASAAGYDKRRHGPLLFWLWHRTGIAVRLFERVNGVELPAGGEVEEEEPQSTTHLPLAIPEAGDEAQTKVALLLTFGVSYGKGNDDRLPTQEELEQAVSEAVNDLITPAVSEGLSISDEVPGDIGILSFKLSVREADDEDEDDADDDEEDDDGKGSERA